MYMDVKYRITAVERHKTASCALPWVAGGRGNSLAKSLDLIVEQQTDLQMICAARNVRVQAPYSTENSF